MHVTRVEATPKSGPGLRDVRGDVVRRQLSADHNLELMGVKTIVGFLINSDVPHTEIAARADDLFADPIIEHSITNQSFLGNNEIFSQTPDAVVSVGFKPGVTDNPGKAALDGFRTIFPNASPDSDISTYITYLFYGIPQTTSTEWLSSTLYNNLIQRSFVTDSEMCKSGNFTSCAELSRSPPVPGRLEHHSVHLFLWWGGGLRDQGPVNSPE